MLLQVQEDESGRRYRFMEASAPPYLWLYAARDNFPELDEMPRPDLARQTAAALTL